MKTTPSPPQIFAAERHPLGQLSTGQLVGLIDKLAERQAVGTAALIGGGWRRELVALTPQLRLQVSGVVARLETPGGSHKLEDLAAALEFLHTTSPEADTTCGLWIGAIAYEALHELERIARCPLDPFHAPDLDFHFADTLLTRDPSTGEAELLLLETNYSSTPVAERRREWLPFCREAAAAAPSPPFSGELFTQPRPLLPFAQYLERVERIQEYIRAGDVYQVNFTYPVAAELAAGATGGDILSRLLPAGNAGWGALLRDGEREVVSLSPESFLECTERSLVSRPIKGTAPRDSDAVAERAQRRHLLASVKDHAELSMIVDLVRNDLGRICRAGTVEVAAHAQLLELPALYHLFSEIRGILDAPAAAVLPALFPGGSITGAPKIRAMQIISELEACRRGVYTGAIGWIGLNGTLQFNIAIRTLQRFGEQWHLSTGGGIVHDSSPQAELQESLQKLYSFSGIRLAESS